MQSIESAVSVKITRVKAIKNIYSFNDLRDLESKLVLIRGRRTKGGAEIDRFLDVSVPIKQMKQISYVLLYYCFLGLPLSLQDC